MESAVLNDDRVDGTDPRCCRVNRIEEWDHGLFVWDRHISSQETKRGQTVYRVFKAFGCYGERDIGPLNLVSREPVVV
jgi:hypothetical protein